MWRTTLRAVNALCQGACSLPLSTTSHLRKHVLVSVAGSRTIIPIQSRKIHTLNTNNMPHHHRMASSHLQYENGNNNLNLISTNPPIIKTKRYGGGFNTFNRVHQVVYTQRRFKRIKGKRLMGLGRQMNARRSKIPSRNRQIMRRQLARRLPRRYRIFRNRWFKMKVMFDSFHKSHMNVQDTLDASNLVISAEWRATRYNPFFRIVRIPAPLIRYFEQRRIYQHNKEYDKRVRDALSTIWAGLKEIFPILQKVADRYPQRKNRIKILNLIFWPIALLSLIDSGSVAGKEAVSYIQANSLEMVATLAQFLHQHDMLHYEKPAMYNRGVLLIQRTIGIAKTVANTNNTEQLFYSALGHFLENPTDGMVGHIIYRTLYTMRRYAVNLTASITGSNPASYSHEVNYTQFLAPYIIDTLLHVLFMRSNISMSSTLVDPNFFIRDLTETAVRTMAPFKPWKANTTNAIALSADYNYKINFFRVYDQLRLKPTITNDLKDLYDLTGKTFEYYYDVLMQEIYHDKLLSEYRMLHRMRDRVTQLANENGYPLPPTDVSTINAFVDLSDPRHALAIGHLNYLTKGNAVAYPLFPSPAYEKHYTAHDRLMRAKLPKPGQHHSGWHDAFQAVRLQYSPEMLKLLKSRELQADLLHSCRKLYYLEHELLMKQQEQQQQQQDGYDAVKVDTIKEASHVDTTIMNSIDNMQGDRQLDNNFIQNPPSAITTPGVMNELNKRPSFIAPPLPSTLQVNDTQEGVEPDKIVDVDRIATPIDTTQFGGFGNNSSFGRVVFGDVILSKLPDDPITDDNIDKIDDHIIASPHSLEENEQTNSLYTSSLYLPSSWISTLFKLPTTTTTTTTIIPNNTINNIDTGLDDDDDLSHVGGELSDLIQNMERHMIHNREATDNTTAPGEQLANHHNFSIKNNTKSLNDTDISSTPNVNSTVSSWLSSSLGWIVKPVDRDDTIESEHDHATQDEQDAHHKNNLNVIQSHKKANVQIKFDLTPHPDYVPNQHDSLLHHYQTTHEQVKNNIFAMQGYSLNALPKDSRALKEEGLSVGMFANNNNDNTTTNNVNNNNNNNNQNISQTNTNLQSSSSMHSPDIPKIHREHGEWLERTSGSHISQYQPALSSVINQTMHEHANTKHFADIREYHGVRRLSQVLGVSDDVIVATTSTTMSQLLAARAMLDSSQQLYDPSYDEGWAPRQDFDLGRYQSNINPHKNKPQIANFDRTTNNIEVTSSQTVSRVSLDSLLHEEFAQDQTRRLADQYQHALLDELKKEKQVQSTFGNNKTDNDDTKTHDNTNHSSFFQRDTNVTRLVSYDVKLNHNSKAEHISPRISTKNNIQNDDNLQTKNDDSNITDEEIIQKYPSLLLQPSTVVSSNSTTLSTISSNSPTNIQTTSDIVTKKISKYEQQMLHKHEETRVSIKHLFGNHNDIDYYDNTSQDEQHKTSPTQLFSWYNVRNMQRKSYFQRKAELNNSLLAQFPSSLHDIEDISSSSNATTTQNAGLGTFSSSVPLAQYRSQLVQLLVDISEKPRNTMVQQLIHRFKQKFTGWKMRWSAIKMQTQNYFKMISYTHFTVKQNQLRYDEQRQAILKSSVSGSSSQQQKNSSFLFSSAATAQELLSDSLKRVITETRTSSGADYAGASTMAMSIRAAGSLFQGNTPLLDAVLQTQILNPTSLLTKIMQNVSAWWITAKLLYLQRFSDSPYAYLDYQREIQNEYCIRLQTLQQQLMYGIVTDKERYVHDYLSSLAARLDVCMLQIQYELKRLHKAPIGRIPGQSTLIHPPATSPYTAISSPHVKDGMYTTENAEQTLRGSPVPYDSHIHHV